jgi:hypothetical protein
LGCIIFLEVSLQFSRDLIRRFDVDILHVDIITRRVVISSNSTSPDQPDK